MRVGVIGINHKLAGLQLREHLAKICHKHFGIGVAAYDREQHYVLLSTCNRTEVYFSSEQPADTQSAILSTLVRESGGVEETFDQKLYSFFGHECFHHLCRVVSGLDSAIVAETEIQGQVKAAYEQTSAFALLPKELHYLFQKALKVGKRTRTHYPMGRGVPSLEHAIYSASNHYFQGEPNKRILVVGASEISKKLISFLRGKECQDITLCNRTKAKACAVARKYDLEVLAWEGLLQRWHHYDCLIFATKAPEPILEVKTVAKKKFTPKILFDLSVPRNVDPGVGRHQNMTLMNIDQINRTMKFRRKKLLGLLDEAEEAVKVMAQKQVTLYQEKETFRLTLKQSA